MADENPPFSLAAKRKIAQAVRIVLGTPGDNANVRQPAYPRTGGLFYVKLTKDGGTAGTNTTACSFTYTVKDVTGQQIGTTVAVAKDRLLTCAMNEATKGWAFYDENNDLKVWDCNETMQQQNC